MPSGYSGGTEARLARRLNSDLRQLHPPLTAKEPQRNPLERRLAVIERQVLAEGSVK